MLQDLVENIDNMHDQKGGLQHRDGNYREKQI